MSSLGSLNIQLTLDSVYFEKGLAKSDYQAQKFAKNFKVDMDKMANSAKQFANRTTSYLNNIEQAAKNINTATKWEFRFSNIERFKSLGSQFSQYADQYTQLANKLQLVTNSEAQHARAMADVYNIALKTAQSSQATSSVYQTFAQNAKNLGLAQSDVARLTETVSKAVAISGASSATASNALVQFSQSLLMGKLKAQEFNSLMTQTPSVVQAIAKGLGVTTAELKAMVDKGELTAEKMVEGLKKAESSVNDLYGKTSSTIGGAMQNLSTAAEKWVGEIDKTTGASEKAVKVLGFTAKHLDELGSVLGIAAGGWALYHGKNKVQDFIKRQAAISDEKKAIIEKQKAQQAAIATQLEENITLAKQTSAKLANTLETYNQNKATLESIALQQQKITKDREQIAVEVQGAATRAERIALSNQLKALDAQEIQLTQQKINAEKQLVATKQALKVAYAENAFAQSRAIAGTAAAATTTTVFSRVTAAATNEIRLMTAAAMANPIMTLAFVAGSAAVAFWGFTESQKAAREEALRYADSLDQVKAKIEQMTKAQVDAELVRNKKYIQEEEAALEKLIRKQSELQKSVRENVIREYDAFAGMLSETEKSAEQLAKEQEDLILVTEQVEEKQRNLNKAYENQRDMQAHIPIAELRDRFAELFPNIEQSKIKVDGLNVSIGDFTLKLPSATAEALKFSGAVGSIAQSAINAALAVLQMNNAISGNTKLDAHIADNEKLIAVYKARAAGNQKLANQLQSEINATQKAQNLGIDLNTDAGKAEFERLKKSEFALLEAQGNAKGSGKGKTPKSNDFQKQFGEMSYRLSELKANAKDIQMFGQVSQYQEVKKLTEDITLNAEKYKNFGIEGVEQLKSLATQIDSENQKLEIAKFGYDNTQKIKAMEFELTLLGKTRSEQELLQYGYQLEQEAAKLRIGMTEENIAKLDEEIAKLKERYAILQQEQEKKRSDPVEGIKAGWADIEDRVTDVAGNMQNITVNAFNSMSDALTDFVLTGKGNFRDMATSILKDIAAMTVKMMLFNAIKSGMSAFGGFSNGGFVGGDFATGGYTGDGGKYVPAGIVHRGEYVITKEATRRIGLDYLNYLNYGKRGFASGGGVAVPRVPVSPMVGGSSGETHNNVTISVHIDKDGNTNTSLEQQAQQGKQLGNLIQAKVLEVIAKERRNGGILAH
ncbi:phage tail tape measure protein [Frederiksenia canicola]|uniref:Phage tail tape measure protein n=1 Tax=Frederiksenia canicola TaxID=123824 RepID=A0AAE6X5Z5_9PAST|nr:phage tail tape measure protein [Frederiksenia canicola]QIM65273.1 phage tail tape measure protein [Frederiksenia canicola]RPE96297.1 lambda family phage tail tape measure protein [Frederiksenia canicola]